MKEWQELGKELNSYIKPETFPTAVKFFQRKSEIPDGTRTPLKDLKVKIAHCQAQAIARKYGWTIAMTKEDLGCAISGHTYGWESANIDGAVKFLLKMNYAVERLAKTHEKGIRYPIPAFLRYQPEVGLTLPLTDIFK